MNIRRIMAFFDAYRSLCLLQVLDALGETVPCAKYDSWMVYVPEGDFLSKIGPTEFFKVFFHVSHFSLFAYEVILYVTACNR